MMHVSPPMPSFIRLEMTLQGNSLLNFLLFLTFFLILIFQVSHRHHYFRTQCNISSVPLPVPEPLAVAYHWPVQLALLEGCRRQHYSVPKICVRRPWNHPLLIEKLHRWKNAWKLHVVVLYVVALMIGSGLFVRYCYWGYCYLNSFVPVFVFGNIVLSGVAFTLWFEQYDRSAKLVKDKLL